MPGTNISHRPPTVANNEAKTHHQVSAFKKAMMLLPIALSTTVSYILLVSKKKGWKIPNGFYYDWITGNRASTQTIVQILAAVLGACLLLTVGQILNFLTRRSLLRHPKSLDLIDFLKGLAISHIKEGPAVQASLGIFSYAVHTTRFGYFINDSSTASILDGQPPRFAKSGNTNYTYNGRSFGAGSSVGLNDSSTTMEPHIVSYSYNETAYCIEYQCTHNGSVTLRLREDGGNRQQSNGSHMPATGEEGMQLETSMALTQLLHQPRCHWRSLS